VISGRARSRHVPKRRRRPPFAMPRARALASRGRQPGRVDGPPALMTASRAATVDPSTSTTCSAALLSRKRTAREFTIRRIRRAKYLRFPVKTRREHSEGALYPVCPVGQCRWTGRFRKYKLQLQVMMQNMQRGLGRAGRPARSSWAPLCRSVGFYYEV